MAKKDVPFYLRTKFLFGLYSFVNLLNFMDRGIVPGSTNEFNRFIDKNLDTDTPDVYLGLLQSAFIVGFVIGSILFGHMIHHHGRFFLTGVGMSMWVTAAVFSGMSEFAQSYVFLVFARMLSGFGEASLQCSIPPWIESSAPAGQKGTWLAIFYTAIPVGTASGFAYSSLISSSLGWQWAFFVEAIIMAPCVIFMFSISHHFPCQHHSETRYTPVHATEVPDDRKTISQMTDDNPPAHGPPTMWEEFKIIVQRPIFLCFTAGYAAQTAALIGLSTFGSAFLMGLGYFNSETEASTIFGVLASIAGIIGTPLGGVLIDRLTAKKQRTSSLEQFNLTNIIEDEEDELVANLIESEDETTKKIRETSRLIAICSMFGTTVFCLNYFVYNKGLYLFFVTTGCLFLFMCSSGINLGVMLSVPVGNRSFGIAIMAVAMHAFGDVPSPIIAGLIKDILAPGCVPSASESDDGNIATSDACRDDNQGLRLTMLFIGLWLLWTVVFFSGAWYFNHMGITKINLCDREGERQNSVIEASRALREEYNQRYSKDSRTSNSNNNNNNNDNTDGSKGKYRNSYVSNLSHEQQNVLNNSSNSRRGSKELSASSYPSQKSHLSSDDITGSDNTDVVTYYLNPNPLGDENDAGFAKNRGKQQII